MSSLIDTEISNNLEQFSLEKPDEKKHKFDLYRKRPFSCQEISPAEKALGF